MKPYYKQKDTTIYHGDCLQVMPQLQKVDMVLSDIPYGITACKWDSVIPLESMWNKLLNIKNKKCVFAILASQPFTTTLISSNISMFKYSWVWEKNFATNFLHAKRQPLRITEDIVIFIDGASYYNPIKTRGHLPAQSARGSSKGQLWHGQNTRNYDGGDTDRFPNNILRIKAVDPKQRSHPTQKPVALMEYLIRTYTNEGDTVLDIAMGSGTTGVACQNTGRKFIGIEIEKNYCDVAIKRFSLNN